MSEFQKTSYPFWYCPVFACDFRTHYVKNIKIHLDRVHDYSDESIEKEIDKFWSAKKNNNDFVCEKSRFDPCFPSRLFRGSEAEPNVSLGGG
jgi:hypothetical protein